MKPVFVYGTLRPGKHNFSVAAPFVAQAVDAVAYGYRLMKGSLPFAVVGDETDFIVGNLLYFHHSTYSYAMSALDCLEGFRGQEVGSHNLYDRVSGVVRDLTNQKDIEAWIYLFARPLPPNLPIINDYCLESK